jgi:hypothetical protein
MGAQRRRRRIAHTAHARDARLEELVERTVEGDDAAWRELWLAMEPTLWAITSCFRLTSQLSRSDDERHNIVVQIMGQLRADDFRRLRLFRASGEVTRSFRAWLGVVAARSAISYVRGHAEYLGPDDAGNDGDDGRHRWVELVPMTAEPAELTVDPLRKLEGQSLLTRARAQLRREQHEALVLWLHGSDRREIVRALRLDDDDEAERLVRSAIKRIRDRLAREGPVEKIDRAE